MDDLVSTQWLAAHLRDPDLRVLDGSWHMPQARRDPRAEFLGAHLPGAVFFDIDAIADHATPLPHMLPTAEAFADAVGALGVGEGDRVVVYDTRGVVSAARVWWTFREFGHEAVAVLDGGLPKWKAENRSLESGEPKPAPGIFRAIAQPARVRDLAAMRDNLATRREQVLDARSAGRFAAAEPEPRAGLRGGHIPGSSNVPATRLLDPATKTVLPAAALSAAFKDAGVDPAAPLVTSCGSGVSACMLALGLHLIGAENVAVYDGSWSEWGRPGDTPVESG